MDEEDKEDKIEDKESRNKNEKDKNQQQEDGEDKDGQEVDIKWPRKRERTWMNIKWIKWTQMKKKRMGDWE